jgi:Flp pilus assembly protein TadD
MKLALVRLARGDREKYRKACAALLAVVGKSPPEEVGRYATWACVVGPGAGDLEPVVAITEQFVKDRPEDPDHLTNLGAALFRAGRYDAALKRLTAAEPRFQRARAPQLSATYCWLFLAMTHARLGQQDEARRWLEKAMQAIKQPGPVVLTMPWVRSLTLRLLHREAQGLVKR